MRRAFILSLDNFLFYLSDEKTPCIKGEAFMVEYVREGMNIYWKVLTLYKTSQPLNSSRTSLPHP